jgi:hypothetical protein
LRVTFVLEVSATPVCRKRSYVSAHCTAGRIWRMKPSTSPAQAVVSASFVYYQHAGTSAILDSTGLGIHGGRSCTSTLSTFMSRTQDRLDMWNYIPQFMLKSVDTVRSMMPMWWCQRLSCMKSRCMPVREQCPDTGISLDRTRASGGISSFRMASHTLRQ